MYEYLGRAGAEHPDNLIGVATRFDDPVHTVTLSGELDLASRDRVVQACTATSYVNVVVDLSGVTFMDCAGYSAFVVATAALERRGGWLMLTSSVGEPRRLLGLIEELERERGSTISVRTTRDPSMWASDSGAWESEGHVSSRDRMERWISAMAGGDAAAASRIVLETRTGRRSLAPPELIGATNGS